MVERERERERERGMASNEEEAPVVVLKVSSVKPAKPTVQHIMYMSGVDQLLKAAMPNKSILFYRTDRDSAGAVEVLRGALAGALVAFYPLAGRLVDDGGRLAINCNDAGAQIIEASCGLSFSQLEVDGFRIRPWFLELVPMQTADTSDSLEDPLASIQVTSFAGGMAVGFAIPHSVADGFSSWTFIRAVGQVCRGEPLSVLPIHARALLKPDTLLLNKVQYMPTEELTRIDAAPYSGSDEVIHDAARQGPFKLMHLPPEQLLQKVINFSREMLDTLKKACILTSLSGEDLKGKQGDGRSGYESYVGKVGTTSSVSTFEILSAYLWKRFVVSQQLDDSIRVDYRVPIDVRTRIVPPLTSAFFGNAVVGLTVATTAGELKRESLAATAYRIRHATRQGDDAYIKKAIIAREKGLDLAKLIMGSVMLYNVRNASAFPVYEAGDFGWGAPEAVRPPWEWREGEMTWYPGKTPRSIDVIVALSKSTYADFFSGDLHTNDPIHLHDYK